MEEFKTEQRLGKVHKLTRANFARLTMNEESYHQIFEGYDVYYALNSCCDTVIQIVGLKHDTGSAFEKCPYIQSIEETVGDVDETYETFPALDSSDKPIVIDTQEVGGIGEPVMFLLEDDFGGKKVIALSSLIELVKVAQDLGRIPELSREWYNCIIRENYGEV